MMSTVSRRASALVVLATFVVLTSTGSARPARADEPNVNQAIDQQQQLEAELARQRDRLGELQAQQSGLADSLSRIGTELQRVGLELEAAQESLDELTALLDETRTALARYRSQIASLEQDLTRVATDIEESQVELAERVALLQDHLRAAYEQSRVSLLEVLLSADSIGAATSQLGYLLTLSDEDRQLAGEIAERREQLNIQQETLRNGRDDLARMEADAAQRETELAGQQAEADEARRLLDEKRSEIENFQREQAAELATTAANKDAQAEAIAAQERALAGQRVLVEKLKEEARKLDISYHGRFAWPYQGESWVVTQEFGTTNFNQAHTGIDVSYTNPRCGGPIYAAADGTVLADERPNASYGDTAIGVVIGHSQRLQSWYWHLSSEVVSVGQKVSAGDLIGYEGATGLVTGCHLHMQVMFDEQPVNPRDYLP